jgi:hypothetical protein
MPAVRDTYQADCGGWPCDPLLSEMSELIAQVYSFRDNATVAATRIQKNEVRQGHKWLKVDNFMNGIRIAI